MFLYHYFEETDTHMVLTELNQGAYRISFQSMKTGPNDPHLVFFQNKIPTVNEISRMMDVIHSMKIKYNIPDDIIDQLQNQLYLNV